MNNDLIWIEKWLLNHYGGKQEHKIDIKIETADNPGWHIKIDLSQTELQGKEFIEVSRETSEDDSVICLVRENVFEGFCGPCNLSEALYIFRKWAEDLRKNNNAASLPLIKLIHTSASQNRLLREDDLTWIQQWYLGQCDGDWEHEFGVMFQTMEYPGWHMTINLLGTELEGRIFNELMVKRSDIDWVNCVIQGTDFIGQCGPCNLSEVLHIFRTWAEA